MQIASTSLTPAVVISTLSLLISAVTLYMTRFSAPRLKGSVGSRVIVTKNPWSDTLDPGVVLTLLVHNGGATVGFVEEVLIELRRGPQNSQVGLLRATHEQLDSEMSLGKDLTPASLAVFQPFAVPAGATVAKRIFCTVAGIGTVAQWEEGSYEIATSVLVGGEPPKWVSCSSVQISLTSTVLSSLSNIKRTLEPDGRYFVNWGLTSVPTDDVEREVRKFAKEGSLIP
jgi:hypothetical protein